MPDPTPRERLEYLRGEIQAERISYGEIAELQSLSEFIEPGDVQLLEWAGVPEHADDSPSTDLVLPDGTTYPGRLQLDGDGQPIIREATCGACGFSWNDALITSMTPTPSGRCPNEYGHADTEAEKFLTVTLSAAQHDALMEAIDTCENIWDGQDADALAEQAALGGAKVALENAEPVR